MHIPVVRLACYFHYKIHNQDLHSFPTRRSSDLIHHDKQRKQQREEVGVRHQPAVVVFTFFRFASQNDSRSEEHTSELQSHVNLVCRLLLEKNTYLSYCSPVILSIKYQAMP